MASPVPEATASPDAGLRLVLPGKVRPFGDGAAWIGRGWKLFAAAPLMWIIVTVVLIVVSIASNLVPILGGIVLGTLNPVILAGFVAACRSLEGGGEFEIEHLMAGFTGRFAKLALLGLVIVVSQIVIFLVFGMFAGFSIVMAIMSGSQAELQGAILASIVPMIIGAMVCMLLLIPLLAATWFAPALVYMHDLGVLAAMKASFSAALRNILSGLLFGVLMLVLVVIAVIPLGLGMLVWIPLAVTSSYAAYRAIFTEDAHLDPPVSRMVEAYPPPTPPNPPADAMPFGTPPPLPPTTPGGPAA